MKKISQLFFLGTILLVVAVPTTVARTSFCGTTHIDLNVPIQGMPVRIQQHMLQSSIDTNGSVEVQNLSGKHIDQIDMQVEYDTVQSEIIGLLWYGATTASSPHAYFEKLKISLAPGKSLTLHGESLRVFTVCPESASLTAIRIQFSDGSEFKPISSGWRFEEFPLALPEPHFDPGLLPVQDSAYLLHFTISASGAVGDIRELKGSGGIFPTALMNELQKWRFHPQTRDGVPESSEFRAVLRIIRSSCQIDVCENPFALSDLSSTFILIDLVPESKSVEAPTAGVFEKFEVYFGPISFSGPAQIAW
jgi:hypothetical protein